MMRLMPSDAFESSARGSQLLAKDGKRLKMAQVNKHGVPGPFLYFLTGRPVWVVFFF